MCDTNFQPRKSFEEDWEFKRAFSPAVVTRSLARRSLTVFALFL